MIPIKTAKEAEKMRLACRTASEILDRVSELIRPGITTKEMDEAAADFMQEAGVRKRVSRLSDLGIAFFRETSAFR